MISLFGRREALRQLQNAVDQYLDRGTNSYRNQLDRTLTHATLLHRFGNTRLYRM